MSEVRMTDLKFCIHVRMDVRLLGTESDSLKDGIINEGRVPWPHI